MTSRRWICVLTLFALVSLGLTPAADAAPKKEGGTCFYSGGWELGGSWEEPLVSDQATCNITCADGSQHKTEADDIEECVEDCNEVCDTTTCRPA